MEWVRARRRADRYRFDAPVRGGATTVKILVVDDESLIAMSTADMLIDLGHEAIEAHSGEEALEVLRRCETIDLLLTDYAMPKMNGAQLAVAANELRPGLMILLATGYADVPTLSEPGVGVINKPYLQNELSSEIAKLLKLPRLGSRDEIR